MSRALFRGRSTQRRPGKKLRTTRGAGVTRAAQRLLLHGTVRNSVQLTRGWRRRASEFGVQPEGEQIDRAAVAIVAEIVDELIIPGKMYALGDAKTVIGFEVVFAAIGEAAVSQIHPISSAREWRARWK